MSSYKRKVKRPKDRPVRRQVLDNETSLIYGVMPVLELLRAAPGRFRKIDLSETRHDNRTAELESLARAKGIPVNKVSRKDIDGLVPDGINHQGIVAFVKAAEYISANALIEKALASDDSLLVILDNIEDPGNLGAILRSVECAGATGVFIPDRRAVGLTESAVKASAGAANFVDVAKVKNINSLIEELKKAGIWVVGASGDAKLPYQEWDFCRQTAIVLGSEGKGIRRLTAEKCDALVKIPLCGKIESLNVSVAAGVLLFEALRQKDKKRS